MIDLYIWIHKEPQVRINYIEKFYNSRKSVFSVKRKP